jgi:signal transduction histidine kinase
MDMFVTPDVVAKLQAAISGGAVTAGALIELAWYVRQSNTEQAQQLLQQAQPMLTDNADGTRLMARCLLIEAEIAWLKAELEAAAARVANAQMQFQAPPNLPNRPNLPDLRGLADCHWLHAMIAIDQGQHQHADQALTDCIRQAKLAGDATRAGMAEAVMARWAVFREPLAAIARWDNHFRRDNLPAPLQAWVEDYYSLAKSQISDFAGSLRHGIKAQQLAVATGQLRMAIIHCTNIGENFSHLNDHQSALEWMQRGLELARPTGWPRNIGACMVHTAEAMRHLGQYAAGYELLQQALALMAPLSNARSYAVGLMYLGNLALDLNKPQLALDSFHQLEQRADVLAQSDFQIDARRGLAQAFCQLGQIEPALDVAHASLEIAIKQHDSFRQVRALQTLSAIHAREPQPVTPDVTPAALTYLQQALQVAHAIPSFSAPPELLDALAAEYAKIQAFDLAYQTSLKAHQAWRASHTRDSTNLAIAMQVKHQTERAQAESEHLRQLAQLEARRAAASQQISDTLSHLSTIGQEITTHLDSDAVFHALDCHAVGLMECSSLAIYLLDSDGHTLIRRFCRDGLQHLPSRAIALSDPHANSARCARERRELSIHFKPGDEMLNLVPGSLPSLSNLFAPLIVGERLLGVMSVQALSEDAYGEREWLIFRTLCAYGAIALDNAQAYRQLQQAQVQLVEQEKMAALGALVAGVAHELNTPIGNSLVIASTLADKGRAIDKQITGNSMRRSDLTNFINDTTQASHLIQRGLNSAVDLLHSFKQVAVDRTTAQRRPFELQQTCSEIIATMMNQIKKSGHSLHIEIESDIQMNSYPGPLGQVLTNLINNALLHAFERQTGGAMHLRGQPGAAGMVCITFADNGNGIDAPHLSRIFDPFFTTKLGRGGSGLGLSISYNIVTSLLHGTIRVESQPGQGTTFMLELPLEAPDKTEPMAHVQGKTAN